MWGHTLTKDLPPQQDGEYKEARASHILERLVAHVQTVHCKTQEHSVHPIEALWGAEALGALRVQISSGTLNSHDRTEVVHVTTVHYKVHGVLISHDRSSRGCP